MVLIKECALSARYPPRMCKFKSFGGAVYVTSMPVSYSTDLRWRAVWLVTLRNLTYDEAGEMLYMSGKSVQRYVAAFLSTGNVEPVKQRHGPECMLSDFEQVIVMQLLLEKPSAYLSELQQHLYDTTGTWVHVSTICRTVYRLGYTRKRLQHIALQRSDDLRAQYMAEISLFDPCTLVWVDESGFRQRNSIRAYGYSLRGLRAEDHQLKLGKSRINAIGIMSYQGMEDVYLTEDNVNGDIFEHFVGSCLLPILMPFNGVNTHSVVVMDNCSVHHVERVVEMINSVGALIRFLPPYSPDLNPIELVFSKVKSFIKANYLVVQSTSIPRVVVSMAFNTITQEDCVHYIQHSGYIS